MRSGQVASMPELVRIIRALSKDEGSVSIGELAELINQDSTILTRVIAAANTFGYNPTHIEIASVADAIHTVGFNRVRMLAMSLMLLDHAGRTTTPYEQRHMAAVSLTSGLIAQVAAEHAGVLNPETAFVCASLRNFGRLLLSTFLTHDFREATATAETGEGEQAFTRIFGLTPFSLGYEVLKSANLPPSILNAVRLNEPTGGPEVEWSEKVMHRMASFALKFSEVALNRDLNDRVFAKSQQDLIKKAARDFPFLIERAPNLLKEAEQRLSILSAAAGSAAIGNVVRERLRHRSRRTPISGKPEIADPTPPGYLPPSEPPMPSRPTAEVFNDLEKPTPPRATDKAEPRRPMTTRNAVDSALAQLSDGSRRNENPLPLALNAIWKTLHPQDLFFCGVESSTRTFRIILGKGPLSDRLGERVLIRGHERNAFFLCHDRLINLSVQDTGDPGIARHLPEWLRSADAPRSFLALPVHHERVLQGIFFIGWSTTRDAPFGGEELAPIQSLFDLVAKQSKPNSAIPHRAVA